MTEGTVLPPDPDLSTTREKVMRLYALGHNQVQIAAKLGMSQPNVSYHVRAAQADWRALQRDTPTEDHFTRQLASYDQMLVALEPSMRVGDSKAVDAAGRIANLKAKLLGLDHADRMNERRIRLEEAQQQIAIAALVKVLDHLELTGEAREEAITVLRGELEQEQEL